MKASPQQAERLHHFSHDLRNRLIGLQQVLDRLREPGHLAEREELGLYGEQQFFKALREVECLMDDLEVARGTVVLNPSTFDLASLVRERLELLRYRADRKQVRVNAPLDANLVVHADARVLGDLIDALLSNAFKFSHPGSTVEVLLCSTRSGVELIVRDHGVGLAAEDLPHVFDRFALLGSRPTAGESQGRGTLARAHAWAMAHGGTLGVKSAGPGQGCTFTLCLPPLDGLSSVPDPLRVSD